MSEKILKDHIKKKGVFIAPFNYQLTKLEEVSWVNTIIPELIWIALLIQMNGERDGINIASQLCKICSEVKETDKFPFYGNMSLFYTHNEEQKKTILEKMDYMQKKILSESLESLFVLYPENPLLYLNTTEQKKDVNDETKIISETIKEMFDKTSRLAIETQAALMYFGFESGRFHVTEKSVLSNFPEIQHYPDTELSKIIAAVIRSSTPIFIAEQLKITGNKWSFYFWNRGLEISECDFGD